MQRILVVGSGGSGKTTVARRMGGRRVVVLSSQGEVDQFIASLAAPTNVHTP